MPVQSKIEDEDSKQRTTKGTTLLRSALLYFKMLGSCLVLYGMGYFRMSTSWLIFGCLTYFVYSRALQKRALLIDGLKTIGKNEKQVILESIAIRELPSWVYFPDVERAEWVNRILKRMWPYICNYVTNILIESVQPSVENSLPAALKPFSFTKIDLGDTPPRIGGVKVYESESIKRNEIVMDVDLLLYSDARIRVQCGKVVAGVKEFELRGTLRIVMKPLVPKIPFAGACTVCFLDNPDINFLLTDMGNIMTIPGLQQTLMSAVKDVVASMMVIPNRVPVQLVSDLELKQIRFPPPHGVIRVNVISGRDLKSSDVSFTGKGSSDPYCCVNVGAQSFKTNTCYKTLNPTWNEYFEAVIDSKDGQHLTFEVFDEDQGNKDDPIGTCFVPIETVHKRGFFDAWLTLEGVKRGQLHVKLQWMDLSSDTNAFQQALLDDAQSREFEQAFGNSLSNAYLFVLVDMATNLSRLKSMTEPSPYASVSLGSQKKVTPIKPKTNSPVWEYVMHFMVTNPLAQDLHVGIRDSKTETKLGEIRIPLRNLVSEPDMTIDRPFILTNTGSSEQSSISLRLELH
ncbi:Extended synaptotagmin-1, partial [Cichlidogyrus casuarinus]